MKRREKMSNKEYRKKTSTSQRINSKVDWSEWRRLWLSCRLCCWWWWWWQRWWLRDRDSGKGEEEFVWVKECEWHSLFIFRHALMFREKGLFFCLLFSFFLFCFAFCFLLFCFFVWVEHFVSEYFFLFFSFFFSFFFFSQRSFNMFNFASLNVQPCVFFSVRF